MIRSVVTSPTTRARPGPSHRVRHPDRGDPRRLGDPVPEEATAQGAGRGPGHGVPPPVLSLSGFPGLSEPQGVTRRRLERAQDAEPRGERGAHGRSHRALSLRSRRAQLRPAGLEGAWPSPEAWMWAWRKGSRAWEPPSSRPQPEGRAGRAGGKNAGGPRRPHRSIYRLPRDSPSSETLRPESSTH